MTTARCFPVAYRTMIGKYRAKSEDHRMQLKSHLYINHGKNYWYAYFRNIKGNNKVGATEISEPLLTQLSYFIESSDAGLAWSVQGLG
jgi:hypothetical protein